MRTATYDPQWWEDVDGVITQTDGPNPCSRLYPRGLFGRDVASSGTGIVPANIVVTEPVIAETN